MVTLIYMIYFVIFYRACLTSLRFTISCLVIDRWYKIRYAAFDSSHSTSLFYTVNVLRGEWMLIVCCVCANFAQFVSDCVSIIAMLLWFIISYCNWFLQRMFYKSIRFACLRCTRFMFYKFKKWLQRPDQLWGPVHVLQLALLKFFNFTNLIICFIIDIA